MCHELSLNNKIGGQKKRIRNLFLEKISSDIIAISFNQHIHHHQFINKCIDCTYFLSPINVVPCLCKLKMSFHLKTNKSKKGIEYEMNFDAINQFYRIFIRFESMQWTRLNK